MSHALSSAHQYDSSAGSKRAVTPLVGASISNGYDEDHFYGIWTLLYKCNFNCAYCAAQKGKTNKSVFPQELIEPTLEYIAATNKKRYTFTITGGEVSLYPHLHTLLAGFARHFGERQADITLLHNRSADVNWMQSVIDAALPVPVLLTISLHFGQLDMSKLVEKIQHFPPAVRKKKIYIKLLPPPGKISEAAQIKRLFDDADINYRIFFVRDLINNIPDQAYSPEEVRLFKAG